MQAIQNPWIKAKEYLTEKDCKAIGNLEQACRSQDSTALKLELEYKLGAAKGREAGALREANEWLYFDGDMLIGYLGIGCFGGMPELNGMVHPLFRRQGVFRLLCASALADLRRRRIKSALLLCDRLSSAGQQFLQTLEAAYHHSEFEMYLQKVPAGVLEACAAGLSFRKAVNADALEIARQNSIYFGSEREETREEEALLLPEEEEKRGMTIYLAHLDGRAVGKVHVQLTAGTGGIYGLGVLPEYRGRGFGREMLLWAVEKLRQMGAARIMLQVATGNSNALRLYESCGFQTTSTMDYYQTAP